MPNLNSFIDFLLSTTPWLAPVIPASMIFTGLVNRLDFSWPIALVGAVVVEFMGLSSINTTIMFWQYNEDKRYFQSLRFIKKPGKKHKIHGAPTFASLLTVVFYASIVLIVNVVLDIGIVPAWHIIAKALLSLLSVVAGVIIALRASHARRLTKSHPVLRASRKPATQSPPVSGGSRIETKEDYFKTNESRDGQGPVSAGELIEIHGIPHATAFRWQHEWREKHGQQGQA